MGKGVSLIKLQEKLGIVWYEKRCKEYLTCDGYESFPRRVAMLKKIEISLTYISCDYMP